MLLLLFFYNYLRYYWRSYAHRSPSLPSMDGSSPVCLLSYCATSPIGLHYPLTFMPQRHNKFSMPHGEKGGEGGG